MKAKCDYKCTPKKNGGTKGDFAKQSAEQKKNKEIRGEIKKGMDIYGYGRAEMAIFLRCSPSTFGRRMREPDTFTVRDMRIMGEKLHIDFSTLI